MSPLYLIQKIQVSSVGTSELEVGKLHLAEEISRDEIE